MSEASPEVLALLSSLVRGRAGLSYRDRDFELLAAKAIPAAHAAGFASLLDYYYFLRYDDPTGAGLAAFCELLVVNETYFFREHVQVERAIERVVLPRIAAGETPRVWSLACSTGEEPLSIAMLLAERDALGQTELHASDVSARALARAQAGKHGVRCLRGSPYDHLVDRWATRDEGNLVTSKSLREAVLWSRKNLANPADISSLGLFDLVFCRNVLIYFDDAGVVAAVNAIATALRPGGVLCLGASESLLRLATPFVCEEQGGAFFYRKPVTR